MRKLLFNNFFFEKLFEDIDNSKETIFCKLFLFRDDSIGKTVMKKLISAAKRRVKILILKDSLAMYFEQFDGNRSSMFLRSNKMFQELLSFPNVEIFNERRFDHSKIWIIDSKISYLGGIGNSEVYVKEQLDCMIRFEDGKITSSLIKNLQGIEDEKKLSLRFLSYSFKGKNNLDTFIQKDFFKIKLDLKVIVSYLGNPHYFENLAKLYRDNVKLNFVLSQKNDFNISRDMHFLWELIRKIELSYTLNIFTYFFGFNSKHKRIQENLKLYSYPQKIHLKAFLLDDSKLLLGSLNLSTSSIINETCVFIDKKDKKNKYIFEEFNTKFQEVISQSNEIDSIRMSYRTQYNKNNITFNFFKSRIDYIVIQLFLFRAYFLNKKKIYYLRELDKKRIRSFYS